MATGDNIFSNLKSMGCDSSRAKMDEIFKNMFFLHGKSKDGMIFSKRLNGKAHDQKMTQTYALVALTLTLTQLL